MGASSELRRSRPSGRSGAAWRLLGRLASALLVMLTLLALAATALYALWLPGYAEERVRQKLVGVSARLGQEVTFGHLEMDGPGSAVLHDVTLARAESLRGHSPMPLLSIPRVEVDVDVASVIDGDPKVLGVRLVAPHAELVRLRDGRTDLDPLLTWLDARVTGKAEEGSGGGGGLAGRALPNLTIEGGTLRVRDELHLARVAPAAGPVTGLLRRARSPLEYARDVEMSVRFAQGGLGPGTRVDVSASLEPTSEPMPVALPRRIKAVIERVEASDDPGWRARVDTEPALVVARLPALPGARLTIEGVAAGTDGTVRALGLRVADRRDDETILKARQASVHLGGADLALETLLLGTISVEGAELHLKTWADGRTNIHGLLAEDRRRDTPARAEAPVEVAAGDEAGEGGLGDELGVGAIKDPIARATQLVRWLPAGLELQQSRLVWTHDGLRTWTAEDASLSVTHKLAAGQVEVRGEFVDDREVRGEVGLRWRRGERQEIGVELKDIDATRLLRQVRPEGLRALRAGRIGGGLEVRFERLDGAMEVDGEVRLTGLTLDHPKLAREPVADMDLALGAKIVWDPVRGDLKISRGRFSLEEAATLRFNVDVLGIGYGGPKAAVDLERVRLSLALDDTPAQAILDAVPHALKAEIDGMKMTGTVGWNFRADIDAEDIAEMQTESDVRLRDFDIVRYNEHTDVRKLNGPFVHRVVQPQTGYEFVVEADGPGWTPLHRISAFVIKALRTNEDGSFYSHKGFSWSQIKATIEQNIRARRVVRGASTVTMQLVKNIFLNHDRTLARKLQEALLTFAVEQVEQIPKNRILEIYLNIVEWGPHVYGIKRAARHYFNRHPAGIKLDEAVFLISILPGPRKFHRYKARGHISDQWWGRMQRLMAVMLERQHITQEEYDEAMAERPSFRRARFEVPDGATEAALPPSPANP